MNIITSDHVHEPSPPDSYRVRKGLEAAGISVCECGAERRVGRSEWVTPVTFEGRTRAANWRKS